MQLRLSAFKRKALILPNSLTVYSLSPEDQLIWNTCTLYQTEPIRSIGSSQEKREKSPLRGALGGTEKTIKSTRHRRRTASLLIPDGAEANENTG
ncbi:hypothetical protein NPIL_617121 [Nephila pilipes]|uniref:Uncharacterized protein n=1 Tax=Nephila pilipes TaxID=299642 RepID=A0A8X6QHA5_NEPPI|nr:hypothetical protein NPIL_617121 [Nephila pilipes]